MGPMGPMGEEHNTNLPWGKGPYKTQPALILATQYSGDTCNGVTASLPTNHNQIDPLTSSKQLLFRAVLLCSLAPPLVIFTL